MGVQVKKPPAGGGNGSLGLIGCARLGTQLDVDVLQFHFWTLEWNDHTVLAGVVGANSFDLPDHGHATTVGEIATSEELDESSVVGVELHSCSCGVSVLKGGDHGECEKFAFVVANKFAVEQTSTDSGG